MGLFLRASGKVKSSQEAPPPSNRGRPLAALLGGLSLTWKRAAADDQEEPPKTNSFWLVRGLELEKNNCCLNSEKTQHENKHNCTKAEL